MIERIKEIASTNTFRQTLVTSSGTIINGLLGMVFYILVARYLGPANFGIFSIAIAAIALIASIANIGIDTGIVRFVGRYMSSEKNKALRFLKLGLEIKILSSLTVLGIGWLIMPFATVSLLGKPELLHPLRLALFGVATSLLFSFITSSIQAIQRFWIWSGLNIFINLLRLMAVVFLFNLGLLLVESSLWLYILFPFFGFVIGLFFLPGFFKVKNEKSVFREFFDYNKWIALFTLIVAFSSRLDIFLSARLLTLGEVGIYSVAVTLSSIVPAIVFAIATVVAPKLASMTNDKDAYNYLKKLQLFVLGLALIGIVVGIPLSYVFIPLFYGSRYLASIAPLSILIVAQAIFLISVPAHTSIFYYFSYPKLFVYISMIHLAILLVGGWFMISAFGYKGAAWIFLIGNIWNFVAPFVWVMRKFK